MTDIEYDIASPDAHQRVRDQADAFLAAGMSNEELLERGADPSCEIGERLATKLALSKRAMTERADKNAKLGVAIAMWGEQRRLRPKTEDNPTGEDSLHTKLDQLDWVFTDTGVDWNLIAVDDGDPDDSAAVAMERAAEHPLGHRVKVLRLADQIETDEGPLGNLKDVDDSKKGGAIVYAAAQATADGCDAMVFTDADNSVDLGQLGLLVGPFLDGTDVVIGDRKHANSVLVKAEARWGPGIVALRHMQRMVGHALFDRGLNDTQAAFKLYNRPTLEDILAAPSTYGFAFDSDWLYTAISGDRSIESVPFAFIDSFAESASIAQGPMTTWESLLKGLVAAARSRNAEHHEEMAAVVDDLADSSTLEKVVQNVPGALADAEPSNLGDPELMTPAELRAWVATL